MVDVRFPKFGYLLYFLYCSCFIREILFEVKTKLFMTLVLLILSVWTSMIKIGISLANAVEKQVYI